MATADVKEQTTVAKIPSVPHHVQHKLSLFDNQPKPSAGFVAAGFSLRSLS
jgi:hypothetical protein